MKVFAAIAVTLALFAISLADEDKKTRILNFYKCISCSEHQAARDEFVKCHKMKPENIQKIAPECTNTVLPDVPQDEIWSTICKNEGDILSKIYDCVMYKEARTDTTEEEKNQFKEFKQCIHKLSEKFCEIKSTKKL